MNILFIHQNFPAQFKHLAPALVLQGHNVFAYRVTKKPRPQFISDSGVRILSYTFDQGTTPKIHPWVADFEAKIIRAQACFDFSLSLKNKGFKPDLIIAHPGWGESIFIKKVWPQSKLAIYCEYFYQSEGYDVDFDKEFGPISNDFACRIEIKNLLNVMHFPTVDHAISPTNWQASTYPADFRSKISVIHEGIDTELVKPNSDSFLMLGETINITKNDEVLTFINRDLEPYRGFHVFMRCLPELLRKKKNLKVVIVGGDSVSYGKKPQDCKSWKEKFVAEVKPQMDKDAFSRIYFVGKIPYRIYIKLLQISTVHVYLTYPFVLSWSFLEAMSAGCSIVASNTPPVSEVMTNGSEGYLVDFFDKNEIIRHILLLLDDENKRKYFSQRARELVVSKYDLKTVCLPKQLDWISSISSI